MTPQQIAEITRYATASKSRARRVIKAMLKADADADNGADIAVVDDDTIAARALRWLLRAGKFANEADALDWLINHPRGHAFMQRNAAHFAKRRTPKRADRGSLEPSAADLRAAKADVVQKLGADAVAVAKAITTSGNTFGLSRDEFVQIIEGYATRQHPTLRKDAAFAKVMEQPEVHQAYRFIKEKHWAETARREIALTKLGALPFGLA
jgi:hypothetical protein